jgi:hypothetical protein
LEGRLVAIESKIDKVMADFNEAMTKVTTNVDIIRMATEANVAANMSLDKPDVAVKAEPVKEVKAEVVIPEVVDEKENDKAEDKTGDVA